MNALIGPVAAPGLHVMSFNVRRPLTGPLGWRPADRWVTRRPRLQALLQTERPTLLGAQEVLPDQAVAIAEALGPAYRYVGHGRRAGHDGEGRGEACPIFFDADRLELIDSAQTALSSRPDVPGSTSWGAIFPRVLVRATFRDRATSVRFTFFNTHLDPFSRRARLREARMLQNEAASTALPTIVTGDFNARAASPTWRAAQGDGVLRDAWAAASARVTPEWATFADYRQPRDAASSRGGRIDSILVSPAIDVEQAGINAARSEGGWASDHLPVQAVVRMTGAAE